jgi:hypothetical protein
MKNELADIVLYGVVFGIGYILGRLRSFVTPIEVTKPASFLKTAGKPNNPAAQPIDIDASKYVAPIDTAGLVRSDTTNSIGKTTATKDDIQGSVSKLAQLKGK